MNTQLNIKARQLFSPTFVMLLIGVVVVLVLSGSSIQAQTATATAAADGPVDSIITLPVKGSVSDPNGSVSVTGNVDVRCRMVKDTTATVNPAIVLLDFDFSQLTGTGGSTKTSVKTYVTGDNHASEMRPLQDSDTVILSVPYYDTTKGELSAKTMLVTATLKFDVATGKLASGSMTVGNNVVTSAAVGTTAQPVMIQQ
jgi:hypothetical protein